MTTPPRKGFFHRALDAVVGIVVALWLLLEEWLWNRLLALMKRLAQLPPIRWLEARIRTLPWALST